MATAPVTVRAPPPIPVPTPVVAPSVVTTTTTTSQLPSQEKLLRPTTQSTGLTMVTPFFSKSAVQQLRESDFTLGAKELIALRYDNCMLVLFYVENRESAEVAKIWAEAGAQVAGPVFAAVNMIIEPKIAEAFTRLNSDPNHPFYAFALRQYPFIIVYRKGWPKAIYNGARSVEAIIDWALTLACRADYSETASKFGSMQAENQWELIEPAPYDFKRTNSTQFTGSAPIRGYSTAIGPVVKGSSQEQAARQVLSQLQAASRPPPGAAPIAGPPPTTPVTTVVAPTVVPGVVTPGTVPPGISVAGPSR